jgi:DNA repair protein RadC
VRIRELKVQYVCRSDPSSPVPPTTLTAPRDAATLFLSLLGSEAVEVFGVLCLTTKHRVLCYHELARGTLDTLAVHPREVFRIALLSNAACVLVGHVHPSGDPTPSPNDIELTRRLVAAGTVMGIEVLDHIVIGEEGRYWSFKETGQL